jgi:hypothetical protein
MSSPDVNQFLRAVVQRIGEQGQTIEIAKDCHVDPMRRFVAAVEGLEVYPADTASVFILWKLGGCKPQASCSWSSIKGPKHAIIPLDANENTSQTQETQPKGQLCGRGMYRRE